MNFKEALKIKELTFKNQGWSDETSEKIFSDYKKTLKEQFPNLNEWQLNYHAVIMMRLEIAFGKCEMLKSNLDESNTIVFICKPDYSS